MLTTIHSIALQGFKPIAINVEIKSISGIPQIVIIGLISSSVREAKDRIVTALKHLGIRLKARRTVISLTPADIPKKDSSFDLPIAVALLSLYRDVKFPLKSTAYLGEVSLDGSIKPIKACLAKVLAAKQLQFRSVCIPYENIRDVRHVEELEIYGISHISELLSLHPKCYLRKPVQKPATSKRSAPSELIRGQFEAVRALAIAIAGHHHLLFVGPPGVGKTVIPHVAKWLSPDLNNSAALESAAVHSLREELSDRDYFKSPFRSPHHSSTAAEMFGSPKRSQPGEVALAHNGILFLDELPEFSNAVLTSLRKTIESNTSSGIFGEEDTLLRSNCLVIASANPCPCGYWQTGIRRCRCTASQRTRYNKKLPGPLLDRFDLLLNLTPLQSDAYATPTGYTTDLPALHQAIVSAQHIQAQRYHSALRSNTQLSLSTLPQYCHFDTSAKSLLNKAQTALNLSTRGYLKVVSVAQTIADLEGTPTITEAHCAEALSYRFENSWTQD